MIDKLSVDVGDIGNFLQYDAGASRALGIFLEDHQSSVRRIVSYTNPSTWDEKEEPSAMYEDVEEGVDGGAMEEASSVSSRAACLQTFCRARRQRWDQGC